MKEKGGDNVMKMTPSILLNIVLVTVLATSMFFISTTASTAEYNPWSDIDGDGEITIYDVVKVTGIYGSSGDPTRNVTVTNWMPPQPKMLFYGEYNVSWYEGVGEVTRLNGGGHLFVGDYTRMSVLLKFDNITVEYGDAYFTVWVEWNDLDNSGATGKHTLSSTIYRVQENGYGSQISTDSYVVKAPYMQLWPEFVGLSDIHEGNAICSVYIYLTHGTPADSTLTTVGYSMMRFTNSDVEKLTSQTQGYRQITAYIYTNVNCHVEVRAFGIPIDAFNKEYGWTIKTYDVTAPSMQIIVDSPSSNPWFIEIKCYITT